LQEIIKDVPVQVLNEEKWNAIFDNTPFKMCGESNGKFEIIDNGGKKALKISQMTANWGVGFDVRHASNPGANVKGVNYKTGDTITIKGSTDMSQGLVLNTKGENGIGKVENWAGTGSFDKVFTLTAAEASEIKANSAKGSLRVHGDSPSGPGRQGTIIVEEFKVEGLRSGGDVEPPPVSYVIDGAGDYMKPADTDTDFYLDLGLAVYGQVNATKLPSAKITQNKLTVKYDLNTQSVFVPFTPELKRIILTAKAWGKDFAINIDGEHSNYFADDPIANQIRAGFANDGGGNWNVTDLPAFNTAAHFGIDRSLSWGSNYTVAKTQGVIIQARQNGNNESIPLVSSGSNVSYTTTIRSVKVVISGAGTPPTALGTIDLKLEEPRAGAEAATTVSGTNFSGTVTWSPAPTEKKFERNQVYTATVALTADPGYGFTASPITQLNGATAPTNASWNALTQVYTIPFARTQAFNELKAGVIWTLSDYLKGKTIGNDAGSPLQNAGGAGAKFGKADGSLTGTGDPDGVIQSGVTANWHGIDIVLSKIDVGINPALYKVKVEVTGKVLTVPETGAGTSQMRIASAGSPYTNPPTSGYANYSASDLDADSDFSMVVNEIVSDYLTKPTGNNGGSLRICGNDDGGIPLATSFIITEIIITNEGLR